MTAHHLFLLALAGLVACASDDGIRHPRTLLVLSLDGVAPAEGEEPGPEAIARVEVAATPLARERGLMYREGLAPDTGMLFVYPKDGPRQFWMKNTKIPLSIAFANEAGRIVRILEMAPGYGAPESSLPIYDSREPAKYALEMRCGWFAERGIAAGDRMRLAPEILAVTPR